MDGRRKEKKKKKRETNCFQNFNFFLIFSHFFFFFFVCFVFNRYCLFIYLLPLLLCAYSGCCNSGLSLPRRNSNNSNNRNSRCFIPNASMRLLYFINGDVPGFFSEQIERTTLHSSGVERVHSSEKLLLDWSGRSAQLVLSESQKVVRRWTLDPFLSSSTTFPRIRAACTDLPAAQRRRLFSRVTENGNPTADQTPSNEDEWYVLRPAAPRPGDVSATPHVFATFSPYWKDGAEKMDLIKGVDFRNKKLSQIELHRRDYGRVYKTIQKGVRSDILQAETHTQRLRMRKEIRREKLIEEVEGTDSAKDQSMMVTMMMNEKQD